MAQRNAKRDKQVAFMNEKIRAPDLLFAFFICLAKQQFLEYQPTNELCIKNIKDFFEKRVTRSGTGTRID